MRYDLQISDYKGRADWRKCVLTLEDEGKTEVVLDRVSTLGEASDLQQLVTLANLALLQGREPTGARAVSVEPNASWQDSAPVVHELKPLTDEEVANVREMIEQYSAMRQPMMLRAEMVITKLDQPETGLKPIRRPIRSVERRITSILYRHLKMPVQKIYDHFPPSVGVPWHEVTQSLFRMRKNGLIDFNAGYHLDRQILVAGDVWLLRNPTLEEEPQSFGAETDTIPGRWVNEKSETYLAEFEPEGMIEGDMPSGTLTIEVSAGYDYETVTPEEYDRENPGTIQPEQAELTSDEMSELQRLEEAMKRERAEHGTYWPEAESWRDRPPLL